MSEQAIMKQLWTKFHHRYTQSWKLCLVCQVEYDAGSFWSALSHFIHTAPHVHTGTQNPCTLALWPAPLKITHASLIDWVLHMQLLGIQSSNYLNCLPCSESSVTLSSLVLLWLSLDTLFFAAEGESWESYWVTAMVSADITWHS